ncbi:10554_t:CDS:2, partial [Diversispora eburnea]
MLGISSHTAGSCTLLHTIKNPIILAKTLLLDPDNPHLFLGGIEDPTGTVGAVAVDANGIIAVATST